MKNLKWLVVILTLVLMVIGSCDMSLNENIWDFDCPDIDLSTAKTKEQKIIKINNWVVNNIKYENDSIDRWETPQETLDSGNGDCDEYAILIIGILNHHGIKADLAVVSENKYKTLDHYCVHVDGKYYSTSDTGYLTILNIIDFNNVQSNLLWHRGL